MKIRIVLSFGTALALAACGTSATGPNAPESPAFNDNPACQEDGRGGHTYGGGNYYPGPCPTP